jgi:UDP-N-acetylglucosamine:LPS N-acetylglucosamine transferase
MVLDRDLTPGSLGAALYPLLDAPSRRTLMASAARTFAHPEAAVTLAETVAAIAQRRK